jgi:tRNA pseudouridine38-40 synthase
MSTWKLTIEYKGTRYQGWQEQTNGKTIQGELRKAAETFLGEKVDLGGSGRTDAGVHALAQVAHLRATRKKNPMALQMGLNDLLPSDIHILKVETATERFHARHSAQARYYLYQISLRRTAFIKDYLWWIKKPLHLERMKECSLLFLGRHDFASFTERPRDQESTVVEVSEITLIQDGDLILIRIGASHFLWKMVRRLVGTMAKAGLAEITLPEVEKYLAAFHLGTGEWTAPSSGLFLEKVIYPGDPFPGPIRPAISFFSH